MRSVIALLGVPALVLCAALGLLVYGAVNAAMRVHNPGPPKLPVALRIVPPPLALDDVVCALARKNGIRPGFARSIIAAESGFRAAALSGKGAIGLMQIMPGTAHDLGIDPSVPEQNLEGGTRYLGLLMNRYKNCPDQLQRAIAAYNAGPGNVDKYQGVPPFPETQSYVKRVMAYYNRFEGRNRNTLRAAAAQQVRTANAD